MSVIHTISGGQHIAAIAAYYGFLDPQPILDANQELVAKRGGPEHLRDGDQVVIPEGHTGEREAGTGREHRFKAKAVTKLIEVRLYTEFRRLPVDDEGNVVAADVGDKAKAGRHWKGPRVAEASVTVLQDGNPVAGGSTGSGGVCQLPVLGDGKWILIVRPADHQLSAGPAAPDPWGNHGLGYWIYNPKTESYDAINNPQIPRPENFQMEFRPLTIEVEVADRALVSASVVDDKRDDRPHHAVLFWRGVEKSDAANVIQVLEIDWKPDFLRRVVATPFLVRAGKKKGRKYLALSPLQRKRRSREQIERLHKDRLIEIAVCHQTAGSSIGSALNTFLTNWRKGRSGVRSGAQFVIDVDGHVVRMADDLYYTQHGGGGPRTSRWNGLSNINDRAIGMEIVHSDSVKGHDDDPSKNPFSRGQYRSVIGLLAELLDRYQIPLNNVIGHNDAVIKARCPGPHFEWTTLEAAGVALAPVAVSDADAEQMFAGFFADKAGKKRALKEGDHSERKDDGSYRVLRNGRILADDLPQCPFEILNTTLSAIGYSPYFGSRKTKPLDEATELHRYGDGTDVCVSQLIRHYCTGLRFLRRQELVYASKAHGRVDYDVAKVIEGLRLALDRL